MRDTALRGVWVLLLGNDVFGEAEVVELHAGLGNEDDGDGGAIGRPIPRVHEHKVNSRLNQRTLALGGFSLSRGTNHSRIKQNPPSRVLELLWLHGFWSVQTTRSRVALFFVDTQPFLHSPAL